MSESTPHAVAALVFTIAVFVLYAIRATSTPASGARRWSRSARCWCRARRTRSPRRSCWPSWHSRRPRSCRCTWPRWRGCWRCSPPGCLKPATIGRALEADVIMLVAASLALGKALLDTGAASALAHAFSDLVVGWPPLAVLGAMVPFVAVITDFESNNAAAAFGTPIAAEAARSLGAPSGACVPAILFGCNLCYATPIGYRTNLLEMSAARYRFADLIRVGAPSLLLMWGVLTALLGGRYALW